MEPRRCLLWNGEGLERERERPRRRESFISRDKYNLVSFIVAGKARVKVAWLCLLSYQNEMHLSKGERTLPSSFITPFLRHSSPLLNDTLCSRIREIAEVSSLSMRTNDEPLRWYEAQLLPLCFFLFFFPFKTGNGIFKLPFDIFDRTSELVWKMKLKIIFFFIAAIFPKKILFKNRGRRDDGGGVGGSFSSRLEEILINRPNLDHATVENWLMK